MKKLILAAFALTAAASVFAQGTVIFNNRIPGGAGVGLSLHIFAPSTTAPGYSLIGIGSNDGPVGVTPLGNVSSMPLIGAGGSGGKYGYATTFAQLIGAAGSNVPESSLVPLGTTTTFRSGTSLGSVASINVTLTGSPAIPKDAAAATFEIVAWDNSALIAGYNLTSWGIEGGKGAFDAWQAGLIAAGHSAPFVTTAIGGDLQPITNLNNDKGNPGGMTSFNLYMIPEPSTMALAGLGLAALITLRRRS